MASKTTAPRKPLRDPPVRSDGKCSYCGGERPYLEDPKGIYRVDLDPFCSTKCCKEYYQVEYDANQAMSRDMSR